MINVIKNSTVYLDKNVNRTAVVKFMRECKENKTDIHSFEIIQNNEVKVRIAPAPYSFEYKQQLYSLSKSFSSTAIGLLVDEGKLSIEDKVIDIFPDKCPEKIGKNTAKMCVKHLLSMNTGHNRCLLYDIRQSGDPVRLFLSFEPENEPGTHFFYNNAATFMLSQIVRRYADMSMYDFLSLRLFDVLGIKNTYWNTFADGNSQGAVGLHASTDDIAKLGLLYLNKGMYNGKRILSERWVNSASAVWSDNSTNGTPDWVAGYGFQFWRNAADGFRGDGAFGQLCVILPSKNMVFAMEAYSDDMQKEMDLLYNLADSLYGESDMSENELNHFIDRYHEPVKYQDAEDKFFEKLYTCEENVFGITFIRFTDNEDSVDVNFSDGTAWQTMRFGKGRFCENNITIKKLKPTLEELAGHDEKENVHFAACCTWKDNSLHLHINYLDNPHIDEYFCEFEGDRLIMQKSTPAEFSYNGEMKGKEL